MSKVKSNININGQKFTNINVEKWDTNVIYVTAKEVAKMVRQYIKQEHPSIKCWVRKESYSMGASVNVSLEKSVYDSIGEELRYELNSRFKSKKFNGMVDSWENFEVLTDLGTQIKFGVDGISVYVKY